MVHDNQHNDDIQHNDTQHNDDIQQNDTQHNDIQNNDTQYNNKNVTFSIMQNIVMLGVSCAGCH
jgi:hypothetical protein